MTAPTVFNCPVCGKPMDLQGTDRSGYGWYSFDLWCHACVAHITLRLKKLKPNYDFANPDNWAAKGHWKGPKI